MSSLGDIVNVGEETYGGKAEECLRNVACLAWDDLAKPELLAAAQVFATLAVADALICHGNGYNVAEAVSAVGGIQP